MFKELQTPSAPFARELQQIDDAEASADHERKAALGLWSAVHSAIHDDVASNHDARFMSTAAKPGGDGIAGKTSNGKTGSAQIANGKAELGVHRGDSVHDKKFFQVQKNIGDAGSWEKAIKAWVKKTVGSRPTTLSAEDIKDALATLSKGGDIRAGVAVLDHRLTWMRHAFKIATAYLLWNKAEQAKGITVTESTTKVDYTALQASINVQITETKKISESIIAKFQSGFEACTLKAGQLSATLTWVLTEVRKLRDFFDSAANTQKMYAKLKSDWAKTKAQLLTEIGDCKEKDKLQADLDKGDAFKMDVSCIATCQTVLDQDVPAMQDAFNKVIDAIKAVAQVYIQGPE
jgi:hypothetical protein